MKIRMVFVFLGIIFLSGCGQYSQTELLEVKQDCLALGLELDNYYTFGDNQVIVCGDKLPEVDQIVTSTRGIKIDPGTSDIFYK